jgi:hypothetical protein
MRHITAFIAYVAALATSSAALSASRATNGIFIKLLRRRLDDESDGDETNGDNDGNELDDDVYSMEIKYAVDKVDVKSESSSTELKYSVEAEKPMLVSMKYEDRISNGTIETSARALLHYVQEWKDSNGDGIMQVDEKITGDKGQRQIGAMGYKPITPLPLPGATSYSFDLVELDNLVGITGHVVAASSIQYDPNQIKFDFYVNNWDYNSSANQLAVLIEVRMKSEVEYENDGGDADLTEITYSSAYASFEWRTTFLYDTADQLGFTGTIQTRLATPDEISALGISAPDEDETPTYMWYCFGKNAAQGKLEPSNNGIEVSLK